ncbi:MAG: AI-2E family transporter [Candidatus Absconditabacteria bacterium]|nr:AI-2E family transporter [Candidatus Absconditabacteria bacterium]
MKIFNNIFDQGKKFLSKISPADKQQLDEIKKLEKQIQAFQEEEQKTKSEMMITNRHFIKFWFVGMLIVFLGFILFKSLDVLYLILTAYIISIAMEAVIDMFQRLKFKRGLSIAIAYLLLIIFLLSGFVLILPFILNQVTDIINILLMKINSFNIRLQNEGLVEILRSSGLLSTYIQKEIFHDFSDPALIIDLQTKIQASISQIARMWTNYAQTLGNFAVTFVTGFATFLTKGLIVVTLSVLFSVEKVAVMKFIASLGGGKKYKYVYIKLEKIYKQLGIWLKSRLLLSLYMAAALYVSLWILELFGMSIPNKLSLALILGLFDIVPYIGPIVGSIPAVIAGLTGFGIWGGVIVGLIAGFINIIENNVLIPLLMSKTLGINTVVIFISMILGGMIMGLVGVLLAVPIAAIITLLFEKDF